jgi:calcineurin-like phosphoesterase family protein
MTATWFIADTHFSHGNIIKYCRRPFVNSREIELMALADAGQIEPHKVRISEESIEWMNSVMIDNLNARVGRDDILWHGGDAFWGRREDFRRARELRDRINCQNINLIWGNHDESSFRPLFDKVAEQTLINVEGQWVFLNHYPMRAWNHSHKGSWMLYGHVHGLYFAEDEQKDILTLDIGVDSHDYKPWSMDELRKWMAKKIPGWTEARRKTDEDRRPSQRKTGTEVTA